MTSDNDPSAAIHAKLDEISTTLTRVKTNQEWVMNDLKEIKETNKACMADIGKKIEVLRGAVNDETSKLDARITELENARWYQKGFFAAIGAGIAAMSTYIISLLSS